MNDTMATMIADGLEKLDISGILLVRPNLSGICLLVEDMMREGNVPTELQVLVMERISLGSGNLWEHYPQFSGNFNYPLPCPNSVNLRPEAAQPYYDKGHTRDSARACWAYHNLPRWTGEYGDIRYDALQWLIDYFRTNPRCLSIDELV